MNAKYRERRYDRHDREGEGEGGWPTLPSNPDTLNRVTNNIFGCGTLPRTLARARIPHNIVTLTARVQKF